MDLNWQIALIIGFVLVILPIYLSRDNKKDEKFLNRKLTEEDRFLIHKDHSGRIESAD
jgi:hypothetical protein